MADIKNFNGLFRLDGKIAVVTGGKSLGPLSRSCYSGWRLSSLSREQRQVRIWRSLQEYFAALPHSEHLHPTIVAAVAVALANKTLLSHFQAPAASACTWRRRSSKRERPK